MEEEGEKAGRRCSKILINIGTCVWGAATMPIAAGGEVSGSSPWLSCEILALGLSLANVHLM